MRLGTGKRLMREIRSKDIKISQSDLSTYLVKVATGTYRRLEGKLPSGRARIDPESYSLLVEKTLSGEFELVPKDAEK